MEVWLASFEVWLLWSTKSDESVVCDPGLHFLKSGCCDLKTQRSVQRILSRRHLEHSAGAFVTNQLIWISLNQGANSTWWGRTRKVWGRTRHKVGANSIGGERGAIRHHYFYDVSYQCWFASEKAKIYCYNFNRLDAVVCSHLILAYNVRPAIINAAGLERNGCFSSPLLRNVVL